MARTRSQEGRDFQASKPTKRQLSPDFNRLTSDIGVYAICDLDNTPIYVGQTVSTGESGILGRVRRHITSARSDIIANRQLDVWELAFVRAWAAPGQSQQQIDELEKRVYEKHSGTIVAGKHLGPLAGKFHMPAYQEVPILKPEEVQRRLDPSLRFPRQVRHVDQLLDVILNVKDSVDQRRSLAVHIRRLQQRFTEFTGIVPTDDD